MAIYLGRRPQGDLVRFSSHSIPTCESHGHLYTAVIGPFKTKVGTSYFARYGRNDPHMQTADDAERLARADPLMEQAIVEENMTGQELSIALECEALDQHEYSPQPTPLKTTSQGATPCLFTLNING